MRGYLNKDNIVWLNAADVARELGFTTFATSGESEEKGNLATCGRKIYEGIRWTRVNEYLAEFEFPPVDKDSFIPESEFYLLAMKAKNEKAKKFQDKMAAELARLKANARTNKPALVPQVFNHPQFGNLRSVLIDGEPFFIGKDVAAALGYSNTKQAIIDHVPDKFKKEGVTIRDHLGGINSPVLINEAGLYKLVMRSKMPKAEEFSDWACGEVLPSIRKYGFYSEKPPVETSLFPDEEPVTAKKKRRPLPEFAVVYSSLLDNALVKIGLTCDFNRRIKEVRKETGQDVEDVFTTDFMPLDDARKLESTVKAKFHDKNKGGELYDAPFEQVKTAIRDATNDAFDKLIALAEKVNSPDEKDKLLIRAANLI